MKKIPAYWRPADQMPLPLRFVEVGKLLTETPYAKIYDERTWATYAIVKGGAP
jgi:hypothetical protein